MKRLVIFGISETAERVYDFICRYNLYDVIGFSVDSKYKSIDVFCGKPVWALDNLDEHFDKEMDLLFVAIFWNRLNADRRNVYERLKAKGYNCANIISPLASVRGEIVGDNCWIMDYVVIQENVKIQNDVFIADFCLVGHSALIKSHAFLSARANVFGSCIIGEQSFVGVNASIFDDTFIGDKCIVGACTIIKRNVPMYSVCKTTNDMTLVKQYTDDVIETKWMANHNVR